MKTKKLIELLQQEDPSGELEVCVGNCDIHFVQQLPGYYDGCQEVLIRDESRKFYNIIGAKYNASGKKINIHTLSISDAIWNDHNMPVDYSDLPAGRAASYKESDEKTRQSANDCSYQVELEYFTKHIKKRAAEIYGNMERLDYLCKVFFDENLSPDAPIPEDIPWLGDSYIGRREKQWLREIDVSFDGCDWHITKKEV